MIVKSMLKVLHARGSQFEIFLFFCMYEITSIKHTTLQKPITIKAYFIKQMMVKMAKYLSNI